MVRGEPNAEIRNIAEEINQLIEGIALRDGVKYRVGSPRIAIEVRTGYMRKISGCGEFRLNAGDNEQRNAGNPRLMRYSSQ
ncbi:hypothetical protein ACN38_g7618 [Penicillium nordicum]|uniref:Uncharacterized protein n=1 Tax=Penicillium nordicum TaxID=229535 RepID=A0A0M8P6P7_9EURO|nr:hypothetical protein ACN38_g7618 [Penicillium nordicum]